MRYGFCTGFATDPLFSVDTRLEAAAAAWGYDFIEYPLMCIATLSDGEFNALMERKERYRLSCDCAANLFPGSVPVIGPAVSERNIRSYLDLTLSRASILGVSKLIFGSAGARKRGDFPKETADRQFQDCLSLLEEYCRQYRMTVLIEAIRTGEADYINTLDEAAAVVRTAQKHGLKHIALMADLFHMQSNREPLSSLEEHFDLLRHIHVCETDRQLPGARFSDRLHDALSLLHSLGYNASVSYESVCPDSEKEGRRTLALLKDPFENSPVMAHL